MLRRILIALAATALTGGVLATATPSAHASETAVITGTLTMPDGSPVVGVQVAAVPVPRTFPYPSTDTGADGAYRLDDVPPGKYRIEFRFPEAGHVVAHSQFAHHATEESRGKRFTVRAGQAIVVDETVMPTGTLSVTAQDELGAPLQAFCAEGLAMRYRANACTETGTVLLPDIRADEYGVAVTLPGSGSIYGFAFTTVVAGETSQVTVAAR